MIIIIVMYTLMLPPVANLSVENEIIIIGLTLIIIIIVVFFCEQKKISTTKKTFSQTNYIY